MPPPPFLFRLSLLAIQVHTNAGQRSVVFRQRRAKLWACRRLVQIQIRVGQQQGEDYESSASRRSGQQISGDADDGRLRCFPAAFPTRNIGTEVITGKRWLREGVSRLRTLALCCAGACVVVDSRQGPPRNAWQALVARTVAVQKLRGGSSTAGALAFAHCCIRCLIGRCQPRSEQRPHFAGRAPCSTCEDFC